MVTLSVQLALTRCPHCSVDTPTLQHVTNFETKDYLQSNHRFWRVYACSRCGGAVLAAAGGYDQETREMYPSGAELDGSIPERGRAYLDQALHSLSAPAGAIMLAASAVDAMLKARGMKDGSLYARIDQAAAENLITADMARWAHEVRLDANDQRHADEEVPLPAPEDARRTVDFALALAQLMFVLPARVSRGIQESSTGG